MRARLLKPGFFANEELGELEPLARLLFQGLWCLADREGRLDDRPKRIKGDVLRYDDCDVDALLNRLVAGGFIRRYARDGKAYIEIVTFTTHQHCHKNEPDSVIPAPDVADSENAPSAPSNVGSRTDIGGPTPTIVRTTPAEAFNGSLKRKPLTEAEAVNARKGADGATAPAPEPTDVAPKQKSRDAGPQPSEAGYEFVSQFCSETGDAFTGDRRRREALSADELIRKAGGSDAALEYVRWRIGSGQSPVLQFCARDYVASWRQRARASPGKRGYTADELAAMAGDGA